jgi:hypothetical protein
MCAAQPIEELLFYDVLSTEGNAESNLKITDEFLALSIPSCCI